MEASKQASFALWITGLPASGKSTLAAALKSQLAERGIDVAVLASDSLRKILTPHPRYDEAERDKFYRQMAYIGTLLVEHGVPVIFDATANLRIYRSRAREQIRNFLEIYVDSAVSVCVARDPKGIYRQAQAGSTATVPGVQALYEPPEAPDLIVHGDRETPEAAARRVVVRLADKGYIRHI